MNHEIQSPAWTGQTGHRVLIEVGDWARQVSLADLLHQAGYLTATCSGPESSDGRCALVAGGECDACHEADVVVHAIRHSDPRNREVLLKLRSLHPRTPIIVEVPGPRAERYPADFEGCTVLPQPMTADVLLDAIANALSSRN